MIPKHGKAIVKTDIAISIPENTYARVGKCVVSDKFGSDILYFVILT